MPTYVLEKEVNGEKNKIEVQCSYEEMQEMCAEYGLRHIIQAPSMVTDTKGTLTRAGSEWRDHLERIKKKSGKGNTIKT